MSHNKNHASEHESGGEDEIDTANLPPTVIQDSDEAGASTTGGWILARRFSKTLETAKYMVFMQASVEAGGGVVASARPEINGTRLGRWWEWHSSFSTQTTFYLLDATAGSYDFDFYFRVHSGIGTAYLKEMRLFIIKVVE